MYIGLLRKFAPTQHITLAFSGFEETMADYKRAVAAVAEVATDWTHGPLTAVYSGELEVFGPRNNTIVSTVSGKSLYTFRNDLTNALDRWSVWYSDEYEFRPHVTLKGASPMALVGQETFSRVAIVSDRFGITEVRI